MKNKLLFKIIRFFRALGINPQDITLDLENNEDMANLAKKLFGAILNLPEMEEEYYDIVCELYNCKKEEAEDKDIFDVVPHLLKGIKGNSAFSIGVLKNTK